MCGPRRNLYFAEAADTSQPPCRDLPMPELPPRGQTETVMFKRTEQSRAARYVVLLVAAMTFSNQAGAEAQHEHERDAPAREPASFVANSGRSFMQMAQDAMTAMERGMRSAAMNGVPDHDFVTMMIPHHQGAIDMARALLLSTKDPELRNLAQGIITEQENEIRVMRAWLQRHAERRR